MKKLKVGKLAAGLAAAILALALVGCGEHKPDAVSDDSLQKVLDAGQLVIGYDAGFPPMTFLDASGDVVGFDIDVAKIVCRQLGVSLIKKPIDWENKEDALNSGEVDCIWSAMSATPARAEAMNLSDPYMRNELIFVVSRSSDARVPHDLKGKTVGVQLGSTGQEFLEASDIYTDISVILGDNISLLRQLQNGELDAVLIDSVLAYYFFYTSDEQFFVLSDSLGEEGYAIGFRKLDQALRDRIQEILNGMSADGSLGEISRKWFGSDITIIH